MSDLDAGEAATQSTRRRFFEQLAAVGGVSLAMAGMDALGFGCASAAVAPPKLDGGAKNTKVVILGAGLAGLTAAYELGNAGYQVQVLEARGVAGGRVQTARRGFAETDVLGNRQVCDFDEGQYINLGAWRIPYHHHSTLHYVRKFNVPVEMFNNDNDAAYVYFEGGKGPLAGKPIRKAQIAADARGCTAELMAKVAARGDLDATLSPADRQTFIDYLVNEGRLRPSDLSYGGTDGRGYDVPPGAGVDPGPGRPSKPFAFADILNSRSWAVLTSVSDWEHQRTMLQAVGGMDQIPRAFARNLPKGVITYDARADRISQSPTGVSVSYTAARGAKADVEGDYLICTIPLSVLKRIQMDASPAFLEAMSHASYAPVNKIGLQMKTRFWEEKHGIYGGHVYNDIPGVSTISLPSHGLHERKGTVLGYYAFGGEAARISALKPEARARFAVEQGQKIFPEYRENFESAFSKSWHLDRHNLGAWADWSDDARKTAYPLLNEPDGRIYLAGEHLSYLPGWMAGAIESAWQQVAKIHARAHAA
jgi:monoamine oxidase